MSAIRCCVGTCKARLEGQKVEPIKGTALVRVTCPRGHEQTARGNRAALEEAMKGDLFARATSGATSEEQPDRVEWGSRA